MLMHSSGQWIQSEYLLPMDKVTPQGAGAAITYARRYALQALVGIPSVDDDGELAMYRNEPVVAEVAPQKRVSKKLMQDCMALVINAESTDEHTLMNEALGELDEVEKQKLWSQLTGKQQEFVRSKKGM